MIKRLFSILCYVITDIGSCLICRLEHVLIFSSVSDFRVVELLLLTKSLSQHHAT